jgi:hypothetical protein
MAWNLFEKIINALKPSENSKQTEDDFAPVASESQWSEQEESQQPEETQQTVDNQQQDNTQY